MDRGKLEAEFFFADWNETNSRSFFRMDSRYRDIV